MGRDLEVEEEEEEWEGSVFADGGGGEKTGLSTQYTVAARGGKMSQERPSVPSPFCKFVRNAFCLSYLFVFLCEVRT